MLGGSWIGTLSYILVGLVSGGSLTFWGLDGFDLFLQRKKKKHEMKNWLELDSWTL